MAMPMMRRVVGRSDPTEFFIYDSSSNGGYPLPKKPRRRHHVPPSSPVMEVPAAATARHDPFSNLPDECICLIFSFLPLTRHRCSCAAVSRRWLLLQAHMRAAEFRSISRASTVDISLPSGECNKGEDIKGGEKESRCLDSRKASDARLASMAVGACARGALTELTISTNFFLPPSGSTLLSVTDVGLKAVAQACPKLRRLTLSRCNMVGNEGLDAIARSCPTLVDLYICHAPLLSDGGLIPVAMNCPKLSVLSLSKCPLVGDGTLRALGRFSSSLESISLEHCPLVTDAGLAVLFSSVPRLANISIAHSKVGDGALEMVGASCGGSPIRKLCLENVSGFTHLGFRRLLLAANQLQSLSVRSCARLNCSSCLEVHGGSVNGGGRTPLPRETQHVGLRNLALSCCENFSDAGLVQLSEAATQLESLQLERCHSVTTAGVMCALKNWSATLKFLTLVECNGIRCDQSLKAPLSVRCPLLQSLEIKRCPGVGNEFISLMGMAMAKATRVAVVGMGTMITDWGIISLLASMERCDGVHTVYLRGCPAVSDWTVAALVLASGRSLRRLVLEGCEGVTDCSLRLIGLLCPALVELDLTRCCRISDGGVAALLAGEGGGSAAVAAGGAGKKSRLEVLSLEGCKGITDECLGILEEMAVEGSLMGLNLKRCGGLSRAGVDAVRRALWWCDLIY